MSQDSTPETWLPPVHLQQQSMKPSNPDSAISRATSRLRGGFILVFRSHRRTLSANDKPTQGFEVAAFLVFCLIVAAIAFLIYARLHGQH
jgi:hypothetical protein